MKRTFVKSARNDAWSEEDIEVMAQGYMDDGEVTRENIVADLENEPYFYNWFDEIMEMDEEDKEEAQQAYSDKLDEIADLVVEEIERKGGMVVSSKKIQSSLKEELEKQMKERHLKLNPDGETPDLSAAVEYIEQNDDWYIGTDEQKARKWIRDTLENSDDLITSSVNKDKIYSRESKKDFNERMTAFNKIGADDFDEVVEDAIGADTYADFKKKILKVYPDFEEEKLRDIWYGTGDYVDPAEGRDKPRKMKTRDYDAIYGDDVYSLGSYDD